MKKEKLIKIIYEFMWEESEWIVDCMIEDKDNYKDILIVKEYKPYLNKFHIKQIELITKNWAKIWKTIMKFDNIENQLANRTFEIGKILAYWKMLKIIQGDNNENNIAMKKIDWDEYKEMCNKCNDRTANYIDDYGLLLCEKCAFHQENNND